MNILYVDLLYDYGVSSRGLNVIGQDGFKKTFERLGHFVDVFYYDDYLGRIDELQTLIKVKADESKPDLIFFSLFGNQFEIKTLEYLKSKYLTINWFGDDQWRFDGFTYKYAPFFSWCITTDKFAIDKYLAIGQKNVIYSQWAAIDEHPIPEFDGTYKYDVSFVGGFHPYRKWFIKELAKCGISVTAFGNGWPNGSVDSETMNYIFRHSKINLNISNSTSLDIRYLFSSFGAFVRAIKSRKTNSQIKARNFEIPYFGGFQLTDYVPTLEDYFKVGKEVACYSNVQEATILIKYFLNNDKEREEMKILGHKTALIEHGYAHRLEKILETI